MSNPEIEKLVEDYTIAVATHLRVAADDDLDDKWHAKKVAAKAALLAAFEELRREITLLSSSRPSSIDLRQQVQKLQSENAALAERVRELEAWINEAIPAMRRFMSEATDK